MLKTGARLRSQVCTTEVIVVRAGESDSPLKCGGHPMVEIGATVMDGLSLHSDFAEGTAIGKRYTDPDGTVEILATKPGAGSLSLGDLALGLKNAKPLPSSD
ncbi:hypothetical protein R4282_07135 [Rhodococcus oxybenzonivorans]|uniref:hypothetical protein n=1 Tax=Rhodococcus oxybenzonivorans TaxID=1990687 RepID=UPI00295405E9|nr:hypothetical protein [Rhodococcus oxybenzonivorans]MDV7352786.1 hypothetical protein [Rhodococcus oxybenzonivorans]